MQLFQDSKADDRRALDVDFVESGQATLMRAKRLYERNMFVNAFDALAVALELTVYDTSAQSCSEEQYHAYA